MTQKIMSWCPEPGRASSERVLLTSAYENGRSRAPAEKETSIEGKVLQSGTHLARINAVPQADGTYEAQVHVRLTREPEVAETYIPVGLFGTEGEAWKAAEERAKRAFDENEF